MQICIIIININVLVQPDFVKETLNTLACFTLLNTNTYWILSEWALFTFFIRSNYSVPLALLSLYNFVKKSFMFTRLIYKMFCTLLK